MEDLPLFGRSLPLIWAYLQQMTVKPRRWIRFPIDSKSSYVIRYFSFVIDFQSIKIPKPQYIISLSVVKLRKSDWPMSYTGDGDKPRTFNFCGGFGIRKRTTKGQWPYISCPAHTSSTADCTRNTPFIMHWQYYQKAIAAYFAASNALTVKAQEQQPFILPGDGGISLSVQSTDFG